MDTLDKWLTIDELAGDIKMSRTKLYFITKAIHEDNDQFSQIACAQACIDAAPARKEAVMANYP